MALPFCCHITLGAASYPCKFAGVKSAGVTLKLTTKVSPLLVYTWKITTYKLSELVNISGVWGLDGSQDSLLDGAPDS